MRKMAGGLLLAALLPATACEHDPVVLERHPVDGQHATGLAFESQYLEMDDGVRVAVDVYGPWATPDRAVVPPSWK